MTGLRLSWRLPAGHGGRCDGRLSVDPQPGMTAASSRRTGSVISTGSSTADGVRFGHNQTRPAAFSALSLNASASAAAAAASRSASNSCLYL